MRRPTLVIVLAAVLAAGTGAAAQAAPAPVAKSLKSTLKTLKAKTELPILLPSTLPMQPLAGKPFYPVVTATSKRWDVVIGYVPDCNGANVCAAGNLAAVKSTRKLNAGDGTKVTLRGGVQGRFWPLQCGANCSAPSITFKTRGMIFTYQLKLDLVKGVSDRQGLVKVANSALAGGLR